MFSDKGKMRIYGAGGCGINIASSFSGHPEQKFFANVQVAYVDTSRSNLKPGMKEEEIFILDADGSGKVRSENYVQISDSVKKILINHPPVDFNVVVFSASGGSGSVIGPMIASNLIARKQNVVCCVVGSDESLRAAENTLNTFKTLEGISRKLNRPLVMNYNHNTRGRKRSDVDEVVKEKISFLAILASREIDELDSMDITNWLYYDKVTNVKPSLALMDVYYDSSDIPIDFHAHSIINIFRSPDDVVYKVYPEYSCDGFANLEIDGAISCHYAIDVKSLEGYYDAIEAAVNEMRSLHADKHSVRSIVNDADTLDDNGFVL